MADFAEEHLFEPIGMTSTINHDPSGNTLAFMGGQASCQDLARFGLLALNEGEWDGEQVVSADYVREATQPLPGPEHGLRVPVVGEQRRAPGRRPRRGG